MALGEDAVKVTVSLDRETYQALAMLKRRYEGNQSLAVRQALRLAQQTAISEAQRAQKVTGHHV